jgi:tight adherence protein B
MPLNELIAGVSPATLLAIGGLLLGLSPFVAIVVAQQTGPRARLRGRLAALTRADETRGPQKASADRAKQLKTKLRETGHMGARRTVELRLRLERAGLTIPVSRFYLMSAVSALGVTALYLLLGYPLIAGPAVLIAVGLGAPRFLLSRRATRRQRDFTRRFADAIDVIVRGIRSGLPIGECLAIIARESPEPVASEFTLMLEGQRLGMTLKQVLERACRRMPTADMSFFAIVLNLQQQTGGNLAETLGGLSNLLRSRKKMTDKIRATSAEARMTAAIIGCLPFLVSAVIYVISPGYMQLLWTDPMGNIILYGGLMWMTIGIFIMKKLITFEI